MKKGWIIGIIAVVLIIALVIIFYHKPAEKIFEGEYDATKEEPITFLSAWIDNLEECQGYSKLSKEEALNEGYSQFCLETTDVDDFNLNKLKEIENIKGISIDNKNINYTYFEQCSSLWEFDYQYVVSMLYHTIMTIYNCSDRFYLTTHTYPGSPELTIYRINPTQETRNILKEEDLIKEWGENCNAQIESTNYSNPEVTFSYPGSRAFLYGGDPQCDHVYREAYNKNNTEICNYLKNENARAICVGSSSTSISNLSMCNSFTPEAREICLMNILLKQKSCSKQSANEICIQINNSLLKSSCFDIIATRFNDTSVCNFEGELKLICLNGYFNKIYSQISFPVSKEGVLFGVDVCNSILNNKKDRTFCYYASIPNFYEFSTNVSYYGDKEVGDMIFYNYSESINQDLIVLHTYNLVTIPNQSSYYDRNYYLCNTIFDDPSNISSECEKLDGDYCSIFSAGCVYTLPHWHY